MIKYLNVLNRTAHPLMSSRLKSLDCLVLLSSTALWQPSIESRRCCDSREISKSVRSETTQLRSAAVYGADSHPGKPLMSGLCGEGFMEKLNKQDDAQTLCVFTTL